MKQHKITILVEDNPDTVIVSGSYSTPVVPIKNKEGVITSWAHTGEKYLHLEIKGNVVSFEVEEINKN